MNYLCTGADSGHKFIVHGDRELRDYLAAAERGDAEPIIRKERIDLRTREGREMHEYLDHCYGGPCSL